MLFVDMNPYICADSTPKSLYQYILDSISEGYGIIMDNPISFQSPKLPKVYGSLAELITYDYTYSKKNRNWITQYYNALRINYQHVTNDNTYKVISETSYMPPSKHVATFLMNPLRFHSPLYDSFYEALIEKRRETYNDISDIVILSRVMLADLKPTEDEFPKGQPDWFRNIYGNDFIAFDPVTKKHIRITKDGKNYRYYTSRISDNWIEIKDVPDEMHYIVDYLISNRNINFG